MEEIVVDANAEEVPKEDRTLGMLCHLLALTGYLGVPLGSIFGPLIMWLIKKDESPFVDRCGREALNFQITMFIAFLICVPLALILVGIILMFVIAIYSLVLTIIASIRANEGKHYRYPFAFRFL